MGTRQFWWKLLPTFFALSGYVVGADDPGPAEARRRHGLDPAAPLESRVKDAAAGLIKLFEDDGRPSPTVHVLTPGERSKLKAALDSLPPLHRRVLADRLRAVSFLDGMPNTALTSPANPDEPYRLFDITVNASILHQGLSEWLTGKERTCFDAAGSPLRVDIDAGTKLDAIAYVILHEATHVVDSCLRITPDPDREGRPPDAGGLARHPFTEGIWSGLASPAPRFIDPVRGRVDFYAQGGAVPIARAKDVYESLRRTPFVSLYGGRNWLDDLAEYVAVYHLTEVLGQPYRIVIREGATEVYAYEPMKSDLVRGRVGEMKRFYSPPPVGPG